jgi:hypothetical protein
VKWVTRKNANVDRTACPWFIRRFVDAEAEILCVEADKVMELAEQEGGTPFDVQGWRSAMWMVAVALSRSSSSSTSRTQPCDSWAGSFTVQTSMRTFASEPESAGLRALAYGFAHLHGDNDEEKLRLLAPVYDPLYVWCQERVARGL